MRRRLITPLLLVLWLCFACSAEQPAGACATLINIDVSSLQTQLTDAMIDKASPEGQKVIRDIAAQLREAAEQATDTFKSALSDGANVIENAAKGSIDLEGIDQAFTTLGEEIENACPSDA